MDDIDISLVKTIIYQNEKNTFSSSIFKHFNLTL